MGDLAKRAAAQEMSGPPTLEDCSAQLSGARERRKAKEDEEERQKKWHAMQTASAKPHADVGTSEAGAAILNGGKVAREVKARKEVEAAESREKGTCGFKKGFFDAAPKKAPKKKKEEEMIVLRPKEKPKPKGHIEGFEMPSIDVTASQVNSVLDMKDKPTDQWMSPELLQAIASDPELLKGFQDPEMQKMMEEIGKDPKAVEKYQDNKRLMKFYERYIKLASSCFSKK